MCEHSENCRYCNTDALLYACMEIAEGKFITIGATEVALFDEYLEASLNNDEELNINLDEVDEEPFQIVYGGVMVNYLYKDNKEAALKFIDKFKDYALGELDEGKKINTSVYKDIQLFPEFAYNSDGNYIPFAALMRTKHRLKDMEYSITMFPLNKSMSIVESMMNRPFLLACRESRLIERITEENWKEYLDIELLEKAYAEADLYTGSTIYEEE